MHDTTGTCRHIKSKGKGATLIHLPAGNQGGVWNPTIRTNNTGCPCKTPGTLWIPPLKKTPGLWTHDSLPINFTLIVNDFGVKCLGNKDGGVD